MTDALMVLAAAGTISPDLAKRFCDAIQGAFQPWQIRRVGEALADAKREDAKAEAYKTRVQAEADADAEITRAETAGKVAKIEARNEIAVQEIYKRAGKRFIEEEIKKQENMEAIAGKAMKQLSADAKPEEVDKDWIFNFFDKCRLTSDKEMQELWAKILSGESNSPGTFSKRSVSCLASLGKNDAEAFAKLCGFVWFLGSRLTALIYGHSPSSRGASSFYKDKGINYEFLSHLEDIGLIRFAPNGNYPSYSSFQIQGTSEIMPAYYYGSIVMIHLHGSMPTGEVMLTNVGIELASVCESKPVEGNLDFVMQRWTLMRLPLSSPFPRVRFENPGIFPSEVEGLM